MSGYICVNGTILDQDKMAEYAGKAGKVIADHGGAIVNRSPAEVLVGQSPHKMLVVIEFPDKKVARGFFDSAEYQALVPIREQALDAIFVLGGD